MAQAEENTTEDKNTFIEASPVNDKAVKRLLRQKKPLTGTQVGRIVFLNVCEMAEGNKQIYNFDEYERLTSKLYVQNEKEYMTFIFYQRLSTYAVNELNEIMIRNNLSLKGMKYIYSQFELLKLNKKIDTEEIQKTVMDYRLNLQYINSYALFFDAMKAMLKDRRLKKEYRIPPLSRKVMISAKNYDEYLSKTYTDEEMQKLGLYYIGEIPRVYTEHSATQKTITSLVEYLQRLFDPKIGSMDGLSTSNIAVDINQRFPRD